MHDRVLKFPGVVKDYEKGTLVRKAASDALNAITGAALALPVASSAEEVQASWRRWLEDNEARLGDG